MDNYINPILKIRLDLANAEIDGHVLGMLYEKYFDLIPGITTDQILSKIQGDRNMAEQSVIRLEEYGCIEGLPNNCAITPDGIDVYKEALLPSVINPRITQRKRILKLLKEKYDKDIHGYVMKEEISKSLQITNVKELAANMRYLGGKGWIDLKEMNAGNFGARLNGHGDSVFDTYQHDESTPMINAYKELFRVENHLRRFIEKKLTEELGNRWWWDGITTEIRNKVDQKKQKESEMHWEIASNGSDVEYLQFSDLKKIIGKNWEVFRTSIKDQNVFSAKLDELEHIRNAIAHTRTLSQDALERLEKHGSDIQNLTT